MNIGIVIIAVVCCFGGMVIADIFNLGGVQTGILIAAVIVLPIVLHDFFMTLHCRFVWKIMEDNPLLVLAVPSAVAAVLFLFVDGRLPIHDERLKVDVFIYFVCVIGSIPTIAIGSALLDHFTPFYRKIAKNILTDKSLRSETTEHQWVPPIGTPSGQNQVPPIGKPVSENPPLNPARFNSFYDPARESYFDPARFKREE